MHGVAMQEEAFRRKCDYEPALVTALHVLAHPPPGILHVAHESLCNYHLVEAMCYPYIGMCIVRITKHHYHLMVLFYPFLSIAP